MGQLPLIIYHINDQRKEKQFAGFCRRIGYRSRAIRRKEYGQEIGVICGVLPSSLGKHEAMPKEAQVPDLMIFSGLSDESLDRFLTEYRKSNLELISLKAIVTPHNILWTVYELAQELKKEHTAMTMGGAAAI